MPNDPGLGACDLAGMANTIAVLLPDVCSIYTRTPVKTATKGTTYTATLRHASVACRSNRGQARLLVGAGMRLSVVTTETVDFAADTDVGDGDALYFADGSRLLVTHLHADRAWEVVRTVDVKALT